MRIRIFSAPLRGRRACRDNPAVVPPGCDMSATLVGSPLFSRAVSNGRCSSLEILKRFDENLYQVIDLLLPVVVPHQDTLLPRRAHLRAKLW